MFYELKYITRGMIDVKEARSEENQKYTVKYISSRVNPEEWRVSLRAKTEKKKRKKIFVSPKCRARKPPRKVLLHMTSANIFRLHCN